MNFLVETILLICLSQKDALHKNFDELNLA